MHPLSLDDPRWRELQHRGGTIPETPDVPKELAWLLEHPEDQQRFNELWPDLCSEGTTWSAGYAAVPHVVEIARRLPPPLRTEHLLFVGFAAICERPDYGEGFQINEYLEPAYREALTQALPLLTDTLGCPHDEITTRYLLAALSALKGFRRLGAIIENLDASLTCPKCNEWFDVLGDWEKLLYGANEGCPRR
jgi:hypothetical protein